MSAKYDKYKETHTYTHHREIAGNTDKDLKIYQRQKTKELQSDEAIKAQRSCNNIFKVMREKRKKHCQPEFYV